MNTFQFYKKQNALVHINVNNQLFKTEQQQLVKQGFESIGEIVKAKTSYEAFNKFKALHFKKIQQINNSHLFVNSALV
ncbi:MAG: hypothetical protein GY951_13645 [Psychromonas sp.]|nr:hypothetical protein [Alteromonadales bacterium]MCP5079085.1 hypothetical protein [Psychromonas sp.]